VVNRNETGLFGACHSLESGPEQLKQWDFKSGLPRVPDMQSGRHTSTGMLKALWDNRKETFCLLDPDLQEAALKAPRCSYKHFLVLLNEGRQIYSDFAHLNPLLTRAGVKNLVFKTLSNESSKNKLGNMWEAYNNRMIHNLRQAASAKKKRDALAEAKSIEKEAQAIESERARLEAELKLAEAANSHSTTRRKTKRKTAEELKILEDLARIERDAKKKRKSVEEKEKEAKEARLEEEKAEKEVQAATAKTTIDDKEPARKKIKVTLVDLTIRKNDDTDNDTDMKAPSRKKGDSAYVSPALKWQQEACHIATLLFGLHYFVKECVLHSRIEVDYDKLKQEDKLLKCKLLADIEIKATEEINRMLEKAKNAKDDKKISTTDTLLFLSKYQGHTEEIYVTLFVRRAFIRLGLVDVKEFCDKGDTVPKVGKCHAKHLVSSLKTWMLEFADRKALYNILRVIHQLDENKKTGALKKLIRGPHFHLGEKESVAKMVDLITSKYGVDHPKKK
jgi:hypothetical protein